MRLSQFSNFAIRVLMYTALRQGHVSTVADMARAYGVSCDHLKKAAAELGRLGYLTTERGRRGGYRLAVDPGVIRVGDVIRQTEGSLALVECFEPATNTCRLISACQLRIALHEAIEAFIAALNRYTLADLVASPDALAPLLGLHGDDVPARATTPSPDA
ncbi:MAG: Rrf2 family transcriptional regulator [Rhodospirillales bacterium]|nr:MAG: Rrf2 family transcriptional regulator [Rhodospirillales bacterium]